MVFSIDFLLIRQTEVLPGSKVELALAIEDLGLIVLVLELEVPLVGDVVHDVRSFVDVDLCVHALVCLEPIFCDA